GLYPSGSVHVHRGRYPLLPFRRHLVHEEHVGAGNRAPGEDLGCALGSDHRCHGAELFTSLDPVEPFQVVPSGGICQKGTVPRGPYSERPWNQATRASSCSARATSAAMSSGRSYSTSASVRKAASPSSSQPRPRSAPTIGSILSPRSAADWSAPPRAVPASPAAGWIHTSSKGPSLTMRLLATQLRATPPAIANRRCPVCSYSHLRTSRSTSSVRCCTLAA